MFSAFLIVACIIAVFGDKIKFSPQDPLGLPLNKNRVWVHLNPKCFAKESDVHTFKDYLLSQYQCIGYNEERKKIYKHPVTANYSVWSLWLERNAPNLHCLDTKINLPQNISIACIDHIYYEPMQHIHQYEYECSAQGTNQGIDLWSLDILDGVFNDIYLYPSFNEPTPIEAIILDTMVDDEHVEFIGTDPLNLFTGTPGPLTSYQHGTHVAGTVVGDEVGGAKGIKLRYYPTCQLGSSCAWSDIEDGYETAIEYMEGQPSDTRFVINYSVGGSRTPTNEAAYTDWGERINANGGIWVTSAGNNNALACNYAPAFSEEAVSVGAYDVGLQAASFSNYGECVDVWGPGVLVWSSTPGDGYGASSGTSM